MNNRIKITGNCCVHCGKTYKKRDNLDKHIPFCELKHNSKKLVLEDDDELVIPSAKNMYFMLIELGKKYNSLEEKMSEMSKWVSKKKKSINVVEWLNTNIAPNMTFDSFMEVRIGFQDADMEFIISSSFYDLMHHVFSRSLFEMEDIPIFAFAQKVNTFYIFQGENIGWFQLSREKMVKWFNKMHMQFVSAFYSWIKVKRAEIVGHSDKFETAFDKANIKLMSVDFRVENMFSKMRGVLFNGLKTDMKALVEYEFEFNL